MNFADAIVDYFVHNGQIELAEMFSKERNQRVDLSWLTSRNDLLCTIEDRDIPKALEAIQQLLPQVTCKNTCIPLTVIRN